MSNHKCVPNPDRVGAELEMHFRRSAYAGDGDLAGASAPVADISQAGPGITGIGLFRFVASL